MLAMVEASSRDDFWRRHVVRWGQSGLSQVDYCAQEGLAKSSFCKWKQRLAGARATQLVEIGFVAAPAGPGICLVLGGGQYRLEIARGFDEDALDRVLDVLEARL